MFPPLRGGWGTSWQQDPSVLVEAAPPLPTPQLWLPEQGPGPQPWLGFQAQPGTQVPDSKPGGGVFVSVPSSPIWREGLGGGGGEEQSHSWLLSGPGGGVGLSWRWGLSWGGGTACLSTPCSHTQCLWVVRRAQFVLGLPGGEGLDLCPQRPQGKGGGAQEPKDSISGARCPSDSCPGSTPSPGCMSAYFHPPSLPVSPGP